ncbi:MAG: phosphoribosyl-AMP cyclohydrolase, partial [Candidatus Thermoplasmatota archaeon]|nr:phosphoribosyl-AMP cyclohydrolase [Candidatus Thermoplasmatota archaeon]
NYFFKDSEGAETKVEFTFGYITDSSGTLRINLHHSSMPASL